MADELRLKIVLDDGSIKEGFLSVEKQADKTAKKIGNSLDNKSNGFNKLSKGAENFTDSLQAAQGGVGSFVSNIASKLGPAGVAVAAITATAAAFGKMALAGEQVNAVNAQFDNLATSAGLSADKFKESIINATQGLIDDEDALQIATKGLVSLGDEAKRLPQILDAARGVSRALGKDFKDSFQDLSQFVETGNARILKNYGIVLDLDKAYEKAAKSIGLTAAQLTEQQKQTVRANELLDQIPRKFGAATDSVTPLKDAFDRLKVSAGNALEGIQVGIANAFTKAFIDNTDLSNVGTTRLNNSLNENRKRLEEINPVIEEYLKKQSRSSLDAIQLNKLLTERTQIIKDNEKAFVEASGRSDQELFAALDASRQAPVDKEKIKLNAEQQKLINQERIKQEQDLSTFLFNEQLKRVNNEIQAQQLSLTNETRADQQKAIANDILNKQIEAQEIQTNLNLLAVDKQFKDQKLLSEAEKNAAVEATTQAHEDQITLIKKRAEADRIKAKKAADQASIQTTSNVLGQIATLQENATGELAEIGKAAAITKATIDGYLAVQNALANVPYPFNFAAAALVGVAAAANVAKIASAGGGGGGSSSFDSGGGIAATPSPITDNTQTQNLERQEASTGVQVIIQGDVLDSDESGSRIVDLINKSFDKKGVVINQGAFA